MGKATEYGQQMIPKSQYHSWLTFFILNPIMGRPCYRTLSCQISFLKVETTLVLLKKRGSLKMAVCLPDGLSAVFFSKHNPSLKAHSPCLILHVAFLSFIFLTFKILMFLVQLLYFLLSFIVHLLYSYSTHR